MCSSIIIKSLLTIVFQDLVWYEFGDGREYYIYMYMMVIKFYDTAQVLSLSVIHYLIYTWHCVIFVYNFYIPLQ